MKHYVSISIACLAVLVAVSCNKDRIGAPAGDSERAICPAAGVFKVNFTKTALWAPVEDVTFPSGLDSIFAVTAYQAELPTEVSGFAPTSRINNIPVNSDSHGNIGFNPRRYYPLNGDKLYFYAYTPMVNATYTDGTATEHPTVVWDFTGHEDIMFAKDETGIDRTGTNQPHFHFSHIFQQIRFRIYRPGTGLGDKLYVNAVRVKGGKTRVKLDLIDQTISYEDDATADIEINGRIYVTEDGTDIPGGILVKAGVTDLDLEIELSGNTYTTSLSLDGTAGQGAPGTCYLVELMFANTVVIPEVSQTDWVTVGTYHQDELLK